MCLFTPTSPRHTGEVPVEYVLRWLKQVVILLSCLIISYRSGGNDMETLLHSTTRTMASSLRDSCNAHPQKSTFIPPFLKNAKPESPKRTVLKDAITASSAFVPPFKKQRKSSKTEEEEETHHFVAPFINHCASPSATKNKIAEDTPIVTLGEPGSEELVTNAISEGPAPEGVCMEGTPSRGKCVVSSLNCQAHSS